MEGHPLGGAVELTVAALVCQHKGDRASVRLPGLLGKSFAGPSVAELLDDAALALMEAVQGWPQQRLNELLLSPEVSLRKVTVDAEIGFLGGKKTATKVRLLAWCTRWPADGLVLVRLPGLCEQPFGVRGLGGLSEAVTNFVREWAKTNARSALVAAAAPSDAYIELVDVDLELPSVLPSTPQRVLDKKRKKPRKPEDPLPKRRWVAATELRAVAASLTHRALDGRLHPALGRDALVDDLVTQLSEDGAAILLVGEAGVGKTAIIEAVAQRFADPSKSLQERTDLWRVDGGRLIAGMSFVGAWERRMGRVVHELYHRRDVLVVDDLPGLAWSGRSAHSDTTMAGFLLPHLQRQEIRVLAECTPERLEAARQRNPGFFASFRVIRVPAMDPARTYRVLLQHLRTVELQRNLVAQPELIESAMALARRFGPRLAEPGRSVTLLRRFLAEARPEGRDELGRGKLRPRQLLAHFGRSTGLPDFVLQVEKGRSPEVLEEAFRQHIVGQPAAVSAAVDVVSVLQQGLDDPQRPVATLLFVGPTGVGKTETAKALASVLFGSGDRLLRFDMSEVQGPAALRRLVGGEGQPDGDLTRAVANQPFSVVLLDEIEKASPVVFDLLLQVLGEGRLTNAVGRTTDFRNTVLVMTSNLGVATAKARTGFSAKGQDADAAHYRAAAQGFFRPEFYNRIDRVVPFDALGLSHVEPLVQRIVGRVLSRRGLRRSGVVVRLDEAYKHWLAEVGFDPQYGARSLQRVIERELTVPLARHLVAEPPDGQGAFVELWREQDSVRVHLHDLRDREVHDAHRPLPSTWPEVHANYEALVDRYAKVTELDRWREVRELRTALLARAAQDRDALAPPDWDLLDVSTAVVEAHHSLGGQLDDFAAEWLATHVYEDDWVKVRRVDSWGYPETTELVTQHRPIAVDRGRLLGQVCERLLRLELAVGALVHRVRSFGPAEPLVLVCERLHEEAADWAAGLCSALASAWSGFGAAELWTRAEGGWQPARVDDSGPRPTAVRLTSPGLRELISPDLGLYLDAVDIGADRRLRVVRVHALPVHEDTATALADREAELAALREARRRGEPEAIDLPAVAHRFGVLRPDAELAPRKSHLAEDLRTLALRRVDAREGGG